MADDATESWSGLFSIHRILLALNLRPYECEPPTLPIQCAVRNRDKSLVQSTDYMLPKPTTIVLTE